MKNKILIVDSSIQVTGALKAIEGVADELSEKFEFHFVIPSGSAVRTYLEKKGNIVVHELPMLELSKRISSILFYFPVLILNAFRLRRLVRAHSMALIHVNDIYNLLPVALRLTGNSTPYICHIRFMPDRFPSVLIKAWLRLHERFAKKIIAVSSAVATRLPASKKVLVIYDGVPQSEKYSWPFQRKPGHHTFLYLSNFMEGKGQNHALRAFAKSQYALTDWRLRFIGSDMGLEKNKVYKESLVALAGELGILEKTDWLPFTNDVELEYKQAEITLNFSESESFSMTCLEAMFFGSAVIATDSGGPGEIIEKKENGCLVPNKDIEAMAMAMERLANDLTLRNSLASAGREHVREKFNRKITSQKMTEVYTQSSRMNY